MKIICPRCSTPKTSSGPRRISRFGRFYRKSDGQWISRFWCSVCKKTFSSAALNPKYRQKKRHLNEKIRKLLCGGFSQRETARYLKIDLKTVARKLLFLAEQETLALQKWNQKHPPCVEVEFDDLETIEHTKLKPLSIPLIVEYKTRRILGFHVALMPAKGRLAALSRKKYGFRKDERIPARQELFEKVKGFVHPMAVIRSDSNPHYPLTVKECFPLAHHETVLGGRGAITGQGELKKLKYDPIFSLNHSFAMLRANINRLFRRTWCTTKRPDRLYAHLALYVMSHNRRLSTA